MSAARVARFRQQAAESELKAAKSKIEETRRAWLIVAREWTKMADRETAKNQSQDSRIGATAAAVPRI
jgi:hypothetical protein